MYEFNQFVSADQVVLYPEIGRLFQSASRTPDRVETF